VPVPFSTVAHNVLFFGAALIVVLVASSVLSRLLKRLVGLGLRLAASEDRGALQKLLERRVARAIVLLTALVSLALVAAAALFSIYAIDVTPLVREWFEDSLVRDPVAVAWLVGKLLLIVLVAAVAHGTARLVADLALDRLQANPAFLQHGPRLTQLRERLAVALRWGARLGALLAAAAVLRWPEVVTDPLTVVTYAVLGVVVARALIALVDVGVDILIQLVRVFEGRKSPLRFLGRLERLGNITKRTFEYVILVGTVTFVGHQLQPDTWLSQAGVMVLRVITLVYIGRVAIEVIGLALNEALLANPERRTPAEQQQRLTLVPVATSILRYGVYFVIAVMGLQELGVDTSPILAGAGLLGLAVGLGAQAFVGDVVSGFFILFEGLFFVGDRIRVGEVIGNVEEIGVRVLQIRDEFGVLHCIPNGEVRQVANHAREYVVAVVDFTLPYEENIPAVIEHLRGFLSQRRAAYPDVLADTEFSVEELKDTGALIRSETRVKPSCDEPIGDALRAELLTGMTAIGVAPSTSYTVTLQRAARGRPSLAEPDASAPDPA